VTHAYNPSYSRGRDQEDCGSKQIVHKSLSQKYLSQKKRAGRVAHGVGPEFKLHYCKKEINVNNRFYKEPERNSTLLISESQIK
jgi:hypothetical protein